MSKTAQLQEILDSSSIDAAVFELRPDYRALLLAVDGLVPGPSDEASDALLLTAEASARQALDWICPRGRGHPHLHGRRGCCRVRHPA